MQRFKLYSLSDLKRLLSIVYCVHMLTLACLPEQNLAEWNKLPSLIAHYQHHQTEHQEHITFWDFMHMHYGQSEHSKEEDHEDLPLFDSFCAGLFFLPEMAVSVNAVSNDMKNINFVELVSNYNMGFSYSIFQPPRI